MSHARVHSRRLGMSLVEIMFRVRKARACSRKREAWHPKIEALLSAVTTLNSASATSLPGKPFTHYLEGGELSHELLNGFPPVTRDLAPPKTLPVLAAHHVFISRPFSRTSPF